jgi:hypothetical protein
MRKKTFYLQFFMETPEGHQISIFDTSKVIKTKIHMRSIRQSLQAQNKKLIKIIETPNQPIEIKKISNKSMFSTSKEKRRQEFVPGLPDRVCKPNLKS